MGVQGHLERPMSGKVELEGKTTGNGVQLTEQFVTGDSTLKVRKPYTITKQRERWTDEEHTRFLEALKLHGRAWKKIEEHVGTKTAVQIRSHAQKFFSKIVREPYNGDVADAKPIEIPPPRPKRKPAHPYPRKLVSLVKTRISIPAKLARSVSQLSSISEQENQSPVSVLSANSSDVSVRANSCTPKGSPHPVSSTLVPKAGLNLGSEVPENIPDDSISQLDSEYEAPNPEEVPLKQESISQNDDLLQKDQSSAQCLKLFGQTLYVNDCFGTSYVTPGTCKHTSLDKEEEKCLFARRDVPLEKVPANPCEDACSPVPLSWLTLSGSAALSTQNVQNPTPITAQPCAKKENQDKNEQDEVSSSGSNTGLASATSTGERSCNVEKPFTLSKLRKRTSANSEDCRKGFAPYKRHSPAPVSSTETAKD